MSDFEKTSTSGQAKQGGKVAVLGVLVAVLVAVGAFHFLKGSPQVAGGAMLPSDDPAAAPADMPTETAAQALAALQNDPTEKLLRATTDTDPTLAKLPTNPFILNDKWRASLIKKPDPVAAAPADRLRPEAVKPAPAAPQSVDGSGLKLSGIFREGQKMAAIINGNIVYVGSVVGNARVVNITEGKVTLQHVNAAKGPTLDLSLTPKN